MSIRAAATTTLVVSLLNAYVMQPILQAQAAGITLPDGSRLSLRLMEALTSETAKAGETVTFEVVEDLLVDGSLLVKQGTPARGVIVEAAQKRRMGRAGTLNYSISETKGVDGQVIRLRAVQDKKGQSNVTSTAVTTAAVAVLVPVAAPFFLLRKGKDITVAEGTRIEAFVDGDHAIRTATAAAVDAPQVAVATAQKLTNADIIGLQAAGFSEDLIVSKIQSSPQGFNLAISDLVELKGKGVSERVIQAMLDSQRR